MRRLIPLTFWSLEFSRFARSHLGFVKPDVTTFGGVRGVTYTCDMHPLDGTSRQSHGVHAPMHIVLYRLIEFSEWPPCCIEEDSRLQMETLNSSGICFTDVRNQMRSVPLPVPSRWRCFLIDSYKHCNRWSRPLLVTPEKTGFKHFHHCCIPYLSTNQSSHLTHLTVYLRVFPVEIWNI